MKIDWVRKLTSRKFWLAIVGLITGLILAFNGSSETAEAVSGVIMSAASVVAYVLGEGFADAAAVKTETKQTEDTEYPEDGYDA